MGNRPKMNTADRAKQFLPFDALKGFREALQEKERIVVPKKELSEEEKEELDLSFRLVCRGDIIRVVYYHNGEYVEQTGMVAKIEETGRILTVVQTKISFADIVAIEKKDRDACGEKSSGCNFQRPEEG